MFYKHKQGYMLTNKNNISKDKLIKLINKNLTVKQIGDFLHTNYSHARRLLIKHDLQTKTKPIRYFKIRKQTLEKLITEGSSIGKMSKMLSRSKGSIRYYLKKYSLKTVASIPINRQYLCINCGENNQSLFYKNSKRLCKKCRNKENTQKYKNYKKDAVELLGGKCLVCGYSKCLAVLDFHHIDPSKKDKNIYRILRRSFKARMSELKKCVILCANHHREVHAGLIKINDFISNNHPASTSART